MRLAAAPLALISCLLVLMAGGLPTFAQSRTTAGLAGKVADETGAALAGATVRVESAALIGGARAVTTGNDGCDRFAVMPPGEYILPGSSGEARPIASGIVGPSWGQARPRAPPDTGPV